MMRLVQRALLVVALGLGFGLAGCGVDGPPSPPEPRVGSSSVFG